MSWPRRVLLLLALLFAVARPAAADEFRPAYLQLREIDASRYDVLWKVPALDEAVVLLTASRFTQVKRLGLLVYLAVEGEHGGCSRDRLLALFWPDSDEERARAALRQSIRFLRLALGQDVLIRHGEALLTISQNVVACDAVACLRALRTQQDETALALYRVEFLPGLSVAGARRNSSNGSSASDRWPSANAGWIFLCPGLTPTHNGSTSTGNSSWHANSTCR